MNTSTNTQLEAVLRDAACRRNEYNPDFWRTSEGVLLMLGQSGLYVLSDNMWQAYRFIPATDLAAVRAAIDAGREERR